MINLAQQGYSHDQIIQLLSRPNGFDKAKYIIEILRNNVSLGEIDFTECTIECSGESEIKYSASMTLADDPRINWRTDMLRPVMIWPEGSVLFRFPFVPLVPVTTTDVITNKGLLKKVEAYDESVFLQDNSLEDVILFEKNTSYISAIKSILTATGFMNINIAPSDKQLATDRLFEVGQKRITIANMLLKEINFRTLEIGIDGILTSYPYELPSVSNANIRYTADKHSLIEINKEVERDSYMRYNRFIGYVSSPDFDQGMRFVFTNSSPSSPTSVQNQRNMIIPAPPRQYDNVANQEVLGDLVIRWAAETAMSYQRVSMNTAIMPHHGVMDSIALNTKGANNIFEETFWSANLVTKKMSHKLRGEIYE